MRISGAVWTSERTKPAKATVTIQMGNGKKACSTCEVTTEKGKYELSVALPGGTYTLRAYDNLGRWLQDTKVCLFDENNARKSDKDANRCVLSRGDNDNIDFTLGKPQARVDWNGTIKDTAGLPQVAVEVVIALADCDECIVRRVKTNERGRYNADQLAAGHYLRSLEFQGLRSRPEPIEVSANQNSLADLTIDKQGSQLIVFEPKQFRPREFRAPDIAANIGRSITGRFRDQSGAVIPGVTVTATREDGRSQATTTDEEGNFRFLNLDPGTYNVEGDARGFTKFVQTDVQVSLSTASVVDATVTPAGVTAATVIVTGGADLVDTVNAGTNVSTEQFSNFPTQRTVASLYVIAPTVARSGLHDVGGERDPSVSGSSGSENIYIMDGVTTTASSGDTGVNLPFEFVQEVEIRTGAYGAQYGSATGGVFNIVTKMGTNHFHGDLYAYGTNRALTWTARNFPLTGSTFAERSTGDVGFDLGGPIVRDKLWFFGGFNPQRATDFYSTQATHQLRQNKVNVPYYVGKLMWSVNNNNTFTLSTLSDVATIKGFLGAGTQTNASGFGSEPSAFEGRQEAGGRRYAFRLNSTIRPNFVAELAGGFLQQRANTVPESTGSQLVNDNFAVIKGDTVLPVVQTGVNFGGETGFIDFVDGRGGMLQRNFLRGSGFGLVSHLQRKNQQVNVHLQNLLGNQSFAWGFEWSHDGYYLNSRSTGPNVTYANPLGLAFTNGADVNQTSGARISNNFLVCAVRINVINCPTNAAVLRAQAIPAATLMSLGLSINGTANPITPNEALASPFLIRISTRVRDFAQLGTASVNSESFYLQSDLRFKDWQFKVGLRSDFQQAAANGKTLLKLNNWWHNLTPRVGVTYDFTSKGKGKLYANYGTFIETPIRLDIAIRASGGALQVDKNFNVNQYAAPSTATIVPGVSSGAVNLGSRTSMIQLDLRPQAMSEATAGIQYELIKDFVLGARGVYKYVKDVIEDGSFDDGETFFIFNPGHNLDGSTVGAACGSNGPTTGLSGCFGRARRYYRALEFTATKRFSNSYQLIGSYVFSSLIGNYEGLFRHEISQSDPSVVSLFDLQSLANNGYGRLPNDRPHQLKIAGSYRTPFRLLISGNFSVQSGVPFNQLIPHAVYGNNEGFAVARGTAVIPPVTAMPAGFPNIVESVGSKRTPTTINLDLGMHYSIKLGEQKELRLTGDWFNVFNSQRALTLDETFSVSTGVADMAPVANPFWGSALLIQPPSAFRLGVKFTF